MRQIHLGWVRSGLGGFILVVALCFQMLPFFLLVIVMAHALGISGGRLLAVIPVFFFGMVFAACWLASKRTPRGLARPLPRLRRTKNRFVRGPAVLLKTRAERYQDLKDILGQVWR